MAEDQSLPFPFRVVVNPSVKSETNEAELEPSPPDDADEGWDLDDIEAAYQQALESLDSLEATVADVVGEPQLPPEDEPLTEATAGLPTAGTPAPDASQSFFTSTPMESQAPTVTSRQVLEALLFVGGKTLPSRQLADVLSGSTSSEDVLRLIDELNEIYDSESRPYRIELEEGGYRMQLRSEFEKIRHRVYGVGPREVKLGQEVLEILSFIAYSQPVSQDELDALGREGTSAIVRQLLRRELIQLKRGDQTEVCYETTPRFLEVFGLRSMQDLPLPGDFAFK
ncbi:MAG: SMC-Scp complex subunit ScpB [Planctomycetota bacterium]|nr:MAG: SMC-Scp complex subunit ScpB [Planctomycetota bacterium]